MSLTRETKIAFQTAMRDPKASTEIIASIESGGSGELSPVDSVSGRTGDVVLSKSDVGLDQVDNTLDVDKPVSLATQTALDTKQPADATLVALSGLTTSANQLIYTAASDLFVTTALTAFARSLLDDADATAARATLGLDQAENTAISMALAAWTGSTDIITVGTVTTGTWNGTSIDVSYLGTGTPEAGFYLDGGTGAWTVLPDAGTGTVTTVGLTAPAALFSVAGSPVTTAGTLAITLVTKTANTVLAGPVSGSAATPTMRALVAADIPDVSATYATVVNLALKADDTAVVHDTGTETIAGTKTFSTAPILATLTGILKATTGALAAATAGTDYLEPDGDGSALTGITGSQISGTLTGVTLASHGGSYASSSSGAFNCATADWFTRTLDGTNGTLSLSNVQSRQQITIELIQDGTGGQTVTYSGMTITWVTSGGVAPTIADAAGLITVLAFKQVSTGNYLGFVVGSQA